MGNDTLILYVDAFDVLLQRPISDVRGAYCEQQWEVNLERLLFRHQGGTIQTERDAEADLARSSAHWVHAEGIHEERLIFAAEENCYPFPNYWWRGEHDDGPLGGAYKHQESAQRVFDMGDGRKLHGDELCFEQERFARGERRFLNSGGVIGRARHLREFLRLTTKLIADGEAMDQATFQLALLRNPSLGVLDHGARIFLGMHVPEKGAATTAAFRGCEEMPVRVGGATPFILHFNGNGKRHYHKCRTKLLGEFQPTHCVGFVDLDRRWNRSVARQLMSIS